MSVSFLIMLAVWRMILSNFPATLTTVVNHCDQKRALVHARSSFFEVSEFNNERMLVEEEDASSGFFQC